MSLEVGSHANEVVRALEEDLLNGFLLPGDRLDERKLAARFGVSRTPIREALQRLAAMGIVVVQPRQGAAIVQLDIPDLLDSFTVDADLEALAAAQAARRILPDQKADLLRAHEACNVAAEAGDFERFNQANDRFHAIIARSSQNRILKSHLRTAKLLTAPYRRKITYQPGRMLASIREHQAIVDAIMASDSDTAAEHMRAHIFQLGAGTSDFLHHLRLSAGVEMRL
jgi:DNA-binding GntR family transcriptional regulator